MSHESTTSRNPMQPLRKSTRIRTESTRSRESASYNKENKEPMRKEKTRPKPVIEPIWKHWTCDVDFNFCVGMNQEKPVKNILPLLVVDLGYLEDVRHIYSKDMAENARDLIADPFPIFENLGFNSDWTITVDLNKKNPGMEFAQWGDKVLQESCLVIELWEMIVKYECSIIDPRVYIGKKKDNGPLNEEEARLFSEIIDEGVFKDEDSGE
ncbi:hypothetical protein BDQ17DRAFT_1449989 [Cyathus striatus]|nr:hypothetical protein BDQ17DRAFT_1449989 [Cyathus striatus]